MNWDQVEGKWKQMKGAAKKQWGKLTDDDLEYMAGSRDQFVGRLQERYGIAKEEAQEAGGPVAPGPGRNEDHQDYDYHRASLRRRGVSHSFRATKSQGVRSSSGRMRFGEDRTMKLFSTAVVWCAGVVVSLAAPGTIHLVQKPAMNKTEIVFSYSGDLWHVGREGGIASRLTSGPGFESDAAFSPDGKTLAFTGEYDGNVDVFTVPASGGVPKRVTFHPDADRVAGWTPDGTRILFRSNRLSQSRYTQLYTVAAEGGLPEVLPLPMGCMGAYSPDGKRMLYAPLDGGQFAPGFTNFVAWKRYRGGSASYLWMLNLGDLTTVKVPRTDSNDIYPMWIGEKTYFLSDRNGPMTLFSYDPQSKKVTELIKNTGKDIMSASAGPGGIVYEQFGQVHIYDIASGKEHTVPIEIAADLTEVRPHFQNVARELRNAAISPTGMRAVFEAHGEVLTVPAEKGEVRNPDQHSRGHGADPGMVAGRQDDRLFLR